MKNRKIITISIICCMSAMIFGCTPKIDISQDITEIEAGQKLDYNKVLSTDQDADIKLLSSSIDTSEVGKYTLTYSIDYNGKTFEKNYDIEVVDTNAPSLKVNRKDIEFGADIDLLDEEYVSAKDEGDDDPSINVVQGSVDTSIPGEYTIVYELSDCYGNKDTQEVTYTVKNKKYSIDELTQYAKERSEDLMRKGYDIEFEIDEFGTGITIVASAGEIKNIGYDLYHLLKFQVVVDSNQDGVVNMFLITAPLSSNIYSETKRIYLKGGDTQIELTGDNILTGDYDYSANNHLFYTIIMALLSKDDSNQNFDKLLQMTTEPEILLRVDGSFTYKDTLDGNFTKTVHEMALIYQDLYDMYNGNYSE